MPVKAQAVANWSWVHRLLGLISGETFCSKLTSPASVRPQEIEGEEMNIKLINMVVRKHIGKHPQGGGFGLMFYYGRRQIEMLMGFFKWFVQVRVWQGKE